MAQAKKIDRGIGALGARWGLQSERAFRNALAGIDKAAQQVTNKLGIETSRDSLEVEIL